MQSQTCQSIFSMSNSVLLRDLRKMAIILSLASQPAAMANVINVKGMVIENQRCKASDEYDSLPSTFWYFTMSVLKSVCVIYISKVRSTRLYGARTHRYKCCW